MNLEEIVYLLIWLLLPQKLLSLRLYPKSKGREEDTTLPSLFYLFHRQKGKIHKYKQVKGKIFVYDMANNKLDATEGSHHKILCELRAINPIDQCWTERKESFYSSSSYYAGKKKGKKPSENYNKHTDPLIKGYYVDCTVDHCTN